MDFAFQFYYPENIDALKEAGAETVFISPLTSQTLPELHALYIGGGFPETHAQELGTNRTYRDHIKQLGLRRLTHRTIRNHNKMFTETVVTG